jgi:hypothetical protein
MAHCVNARGQQEYDKTPDDDQVHYARKRLAQKAPVAQNVPKHGAPKNPRPRAQVLKAVVRLAQSPQLVAPVDTERQKSHADGVQYVHHVTVLYVPEYLS